MDEWQLKTKLKLEKAVYDRMIIRDVNNYIAIYEDVIDENILCDFSNDQTTKILMQL
jgi:hypothetical protein